MRAALIAAAQVSSGKLAQYILGMKIKSSSGWGGWNVDRKGKGNGRGNR